MAAGSAAKSTISIRKPPGFLPLRAMDRARAMGRCPIVCGKTRRRTHGRHSVWHQLLKCRCLLAPERIRTRLVRRRAAGAVLQRRPVHAKMGTELGHSALPMGCDAREQSWLVAPTRPRCKANFSRVPHRSRAWLLSDILLSLASKAKQRIPSAGVESDA